MPWWTCFNCASRTTHTNCNDVVVLDYAHHSLQDVPADVFQYERTLEELYLSSNRITELPRQLFLCHGLKVLDISDNDLTSIPTALSSLINLSKINLARNSLTRLTDSIIACKSLTYLNLSINSLEKLPDAVTGLIGLQELYLNDTFLEYLPANFGRLINLRILELRDNNLITLPKSLNRLTNLKRLDIGNNEFTELTEVIGSLTALTELWCDGNRIRRFNCNVSNLKELIHFDASNNLIQFLPVEMGSWQKCQEICLSANEIEELPFSIGMLKSLISLKVDENQLQELPDSICEMESLEELMLSHNDLFKLPNTIGFLRRLRFLTADENLLRSLPNEICSCSSLTILSVRGNKLSKIPVDIGRLTQLRVLNIVNNFLSNLPVTILNLTRLSALWISDNQSQPLMPLQKEFHKESQSFYLTCYLLPQMNTSNSTSMNAGGSTSIAPDNTYDYYTPSTCDSSQQNMHILAIENLSLAAVAKRKRNICFASDPPQEIAPSLRLMRSPTPYPKELRIMQAKFAANKNMQQHPHHQHHLQKYMHSENDAENLDPSNNVNILNAVTNTQKQQSNVSNNYENTNLMNGVLPQPSPTTMNNFDGDVNPNGMVILSNNIAPNMNVSAMSQPTNSNPLPQMHLSFHNQSHPTLENVSQNSKTSIAPHFDDLYQNGVNDVVQYDSIRKFPAASIDDTDNCNSINGDENSTCEFVNHQQQQQQLQQQQQQYQYQQQHYRPSSVAYSETNSISNENVLKPVINSSIQSYESTPMETEINHNCTQMDSSQQPPPYHIAKVFTKKSKQDLLIYDIYRNNYQQQLPPNGQPYPQHENNSFESQSQTDYHNNSYSTQEIQLNVPKISSDIGFKIVQHYNQGIFISDVDKHSSVHGKLSVRDKILDVDGVDFTKISLVDAETVLSNAGSVMNIMVSRDK